MTARNYALLAAALFAVIAVLQLGRAILGLSIVVGEAVSVPLWASWMAGIGCAILAWLGFRASRL